jgi:ribosomal protein S28E/S33
MPRASIHVVRNDRDVQRFKCDGRRAEFRVRGTPNLVLRVSPTGKAWSFRFRLRQEPKWRAISLGNAAMVDLERARAYAAKMNVEVIEGRDPRTVLQRLVRGLVTVNDLVTEYLAERARKHPRSQQQIERILRRYVLPQLGDYAVDAVTRWRRHAIFRPSSALCVPQT